VEATDAVTEVHAIDAPGALDGTLMDREDDAIALAQWDDHGARLHAWPLLCQYELAASEVSFGFREKDCELKREDVFAVEILVQAIVIAGFVLKQ
jgi:hypothetical protein